ncbi:hypothetical protein A6C57_08600 [Fibrella sp. ES10-3-2-2]|nr:hypothetical protein A6C57_08600 [Fibrella sp. ES10-3-2-2]
MASRTCERLISSKDGKRAIYIDSTNKDEILTHLRQSERYAKKFKHIVEIILEGHRNTELYDKEDINERCKAVTAMKFFKGQENDRLYCKEVTSEGGTHIVIAAVLHPHKKSQGNSKREIALIEKVAGYEYNPDA